MEAPSSGEDRQTPKISVRRAIASDAQILSLLNRDVQAVHAAALPFRFKPPSQHSFPPAEAAALLAKFENLVLLAQVDQDPAGYAYAEIVRRPETSLTYAFEMLYLHHISVGTRFRRQGVGTALLNAVRAAGEDLGITLLSLDVWSFNETARRFFCQHGFHPYNERLWSR
jgi:ribosomal protein S18 acetylase RimI-like enzyme